MFCRPWDSPGKHTGVGCHFLLQCMKVKRESEVAQSCPTPSDPMDCSLPGSSVRGIFQARVLEWGAMPSSRVSSQPRIEPRSCALQMDSLLSEPPSKPKNTGVGSLSLLQGIFPTQESNWGLLHCRQILYQPYNHHPNQETSTSHFPLPSHSTLMGKTILISIN